MAWKTIERFGSRNLTTHTHRKEALSEAKEYLEEWGDNPEWQEWTEKTIHNQGQRLGKFPEFPTSSGKKLQLILEQENGTKLVRMGIRPNRLFTRRTIRTVLDNVDNSSEGDFNYGNKILGFRKR